MASQSSTFVGGGNPTAAQVNGWAQGTLGYQPVTANQGSITTTEADLNSLSVAVTVVANRRIRITGSVLARPGTANDELTLRIKESTTQLQAVAKTLPNTSRDECLERSVIITPTAGAHTYKLSLQVTGGTGTAQMTAGSTFPAFILVEDIGAV